MDKIAQEVLTFWFDDTQTMRKAWFVKSEAFDAEVRSRFLGVYNQALSGQFDSWIESARSCLALVIVLDQFPRNMFRDQPQSFASDAKALSVAQTAVAHQFDQQVPPIQRFFFYLPFEHSENLEHQNQSVALFEQFKNDSQLREVYDYALRHRSVIDRFGRFPHRNRILARPSTPEEVEFLKQPGSSF